MTTIREHEIASLNPGDVVRFRNFNWPEGTAVTGPVYGKRGGSRDELLVAGYPIRTMHVCGTLCEFEIVSRAPRPLYENSDRVEPVPGDVVRDADDDSNTQVWLYADPSPDAAWGWVTHNGPEWWRQRDELPARLRLLVDGTTGMPPEVTS